MIGVKQRLGRRSAAAAGAVVLEAALAVGELFAAGCARALGLLVGQANRHVYAAPAFRPCESRFRDL